MQYHTAYIGIGTNIEPRKERMQAAIDALSRRWILVAQSSLYETSPVGFTDQPHFLNAVAVISTLEAPHGLHRSLKALEQELGRQQRDRWHEREIDFDMLFYDDRIIDDNELTLPHPELHKRAFVLVPLVEIAPEFLHPLLGQSAHAMLAAHTVTDEMIRRFTDE